MSSLATGWKPYYPNMGTVAHFGNLVVSDEKLTRLITPAQVLLHRSSRSNAFSLKLIRSYCRKGRTT